MISTGFYAIQYIIHMYPKQFKAVDKNGPQCFFSFLSWQRSPRYFYSLLYFPYRQTGSHCQTQPSLQGSLCMTLHQILTMYKYMYRYHCYVTLHMHLLPPQYNSVETRQLLQTATLCFLCYHKSSLVPPAHLNKLFNSIFLLLCTHNFSRRGKCNFLYTIQILG